MNGLNFLKILF